jgi:hypothetical protein
MNNGLNIAEEIVSKYRDLVRDAATKKVIDDLVDDWWHKKVEVIVDGKVTGTEYHFEDGSSLTMPDMIASAYSQPMRELTEDQKRLRLRKWREEAE